MGWAVFLAERQLKLGLFRKAHEWQLEIWNSYTQRRGRRRQFGMQVVLLAEVTTLQ